MRQKMARRHEKTSVDHHKETTSDELSALIFYATYLDARGKPVFSETIYASDNFTACSAAMDSLPRGISDFDLVDAAEFPSDSSPFNYTTPGALIRRLQRLVIQKRRDGSHQTTMPSVDTTDALVRTGAETSELLLFDCFIDDEDGAAAYRISSKTCFVASLKDSLESIVSTARRTRSSNQHCHLQGINPLTANVLLKIRLDDDEITRPAVSVRIQEARANQRPIMTPREPVAFGVYRVSDEGQEAVNAPINGTRSVVMGSSLGDIVSRAIDEIPLDQGDYLYGYDPTSGNGLVKIWLSDIDLWKTPKQDKPM